MITAIEIENLKCFSDRQRIELAPITLLYGANNSGKSTAMYALLLFGQWLESRSYSIGPIELTGGERDLGPSYLATHNHRSGQPITIKVEFYESESDVRKAIEICVQPSINDWQARVTRTVVGDVVNLVHVKCEEDGNIVGESWDESVCESMRDELLRHLLNQRIIGALRDVPPVGWATSAAQRFSSRAWARLL